MTKSPTADDRARRPMALAPRLLFVAGIALSMFGVGWYVGEWKVFPHATLRSALVTAKVWKESAWDHPRALARRRELARNAAAEKPWRLEFVSSAALADPVLLQARGPWEFVEHCPAGCIAVQYEGAGGVARAWPFFPDSIDRADRLVDWAYEHPLGSSFAVYAEIESAAVYANGDLMVVFRFPRSHPQGGGVARIDPRGGVVWYRRDYSHHQAHLTKRGIVLVSSSRHIIHNKDREELLPDDPYFDRWFDRWGTTRTFSADYVHVIDEAGALLDEISVLEAVAASPWRGALDNAADPYYDSGDSYSPTHLNFVHEVGAVAGEHSPGSGVADIKPGDLVLSMRNLSAFAVMDRESHRLKRWVQGTWARQHSVTHIEGSRYVVFDNHGGADARESRVLTVDLATGVETVVFPTEDTPQRFRGFLSEFRGYLSVSPDRLRVLAAVQATANNPCSSPGHALDSSLALELSLADGEVLAAFCTSRLASYVDNNPSDLGRPRQEQP